MIAGDGPDREKLEEYVQERGLRHVEFLGFIDEATKKRLLHTCDLFCSPAIFGESFGIVLLEAMAAARGVVLAGNNPGYASVMEPYPEQLFDPREVPDFAKKLARYLADEPARTAAAQAQKTYVKQFDINEVGSQLLVVYKDALQRRS